MELVVVLTVAAASVFFVVTFIGNRHAETRKMLQDELNPMEERLERMQKLLRDLNERNSSLQQQLGKQEDVMRQVLHEVKAPVEL